MSLGRFTLAVFIGIAMSAPVTAQDSSESDQIIHRGTVLYGTGSLHYIRSAISSFGVDNTAVKQTGGDHVVTNLDEHPVHAMRRRKATFEQYEANLKTAKPKTLIATAKEIGLYGQWFVLSGKKDGLFSEAQIGQQPGDVISLRHEEDAPGLLSMG